MLLLAFALSYLAMLAQVKYFHRRARAVLDRLMRAVTGDPDLWSATSGACAAYWKQAYPADRTLRFEKAAWLDEE